MIIGTVIEVGSRKGRLQIGLFPSQGDRGAISDIGHQRHRDVPIGRFMANMFEAMNIES